MNPSPPVVLTLSQALALVRIVDRFQDAEALKALAQEPAKIIALLSDPALASDVEQLLIALLGAQAPHLPVHQLLARIEAELPDRLESLSGYLDTEITSRLEKLAVGLRAMVKA
jgi:hypothetical protein